MPEEKKGLYFPHPMNTYNTVLEARLLEKIEEKFSPDEWLIINPSSPEHQAGFQYYARDGGNPMVYFHAELLQDCHGAVGLPFIDGTWGAGAFKEMIDVYVLGFPIWSIRHTGRITPLLHMHNKRCLTVAQTLERLAHPYECKLFRG